MDRPGRTARTLWISRFRPSPGGSALALLTAAGWALALLACGDAPAPPDAAGSPVRPALRVVASFSILAEWVHEVAGERVEITTLVGAGGDLHAFDPHPAARRALAEADLVVSVAPRLETWLPPLMATANPHVRHRVLASSVDADPHVWLDPRRASDMVGRLAEDLAGLDPAGAEGYRARAERYRGELAVLDGWIAGRLATLPAERRRLVTQHGFLEHFSRRYGLEVVDTLYASSSTETADPPASRLAQLVDRARAAGVVAFFPEQGLDDRLLAQAAREAGARLAPPLLAGGLAPPGRPGATYLDLMRYDTDTLVAALNP